MIAVGTSATIRTSATAFSDSDIGLIQTTLEIATNSPAVETISVTIRTTVTGAVVVTTSTGSATTRSGFPSETAANPPRKTPARVQRREETPVMGGLQSGGFPEVNARCYALSWG